MTAIHSRGLRVSAIPLLVLCLAAVASADCIVLDLLVDPGGAGTWQVVASIQGDDGGAATSAGLGGFRIDVVGTGGIDVATSFNEAPSAAFMDSSGMVHVAGFCEFRQHHAAGRPGLHIQGAQPTIYGTQNDPERDRGVLQGVGIAAGSFEDPFFGAIDWDESAVLASGTYTGEAGALEVSVNPSGFLLLDDVGSGVGFGWAGPGNEHRPSGVKGDLEIIGDYVIPEPPPEPAPDEPAQPAPEPTPDEPAQPAPQPTPDEPTQPAPEPTPDEPAQPAPEPTPDEPTQPAPEPTPDEPSQPAPEPTPDEPSQPAPEPTPDEPTQPAPDPTPEEPTSPEPVESPADPVNDEAPVQTKEPVDDPPLLPVDEPSDQEPPADDDGDPLPVQIVPRPCPSIWNPIWPIYVGDWFEIDGNTPRSVVLLVPPTKERDANTADEVLGEIFLAEAPYPSEWFTVYRTTTCNAADLGLVLAAGEPSPPETPLISPEPGALAILALGAVAVLWRRRRAGSECRRR